MASTVVTYILWFFFGWAGLHHLYLGRVNQAIVWFATLGGGFGIGFIRDIWKIPDYIQWCNGDRATQLRYLHRVVRSPRPGCGLFRFFGMVVMGLVTSHFLGALVPDFNGMLATNPWTYYFLRYTFVALIILGNAIGVYVVANIGELKCEVYYPFIASVCIFPWLLGKSPNLLLASFLTALVTWYRGLRWRPLLDAEERKKIRLCKDIFIYVAVCGVWLSVVFCGFYFNATITTNEGEKIPVREALNNFFKSVAWQRTKDSLFQLLHVLFHSGTGEAWNEAEGLFDFSGELNAFRVLDLPPGSDQDEISKRCRKLSATHHPDRFKTQEEKDLAQEKFIEVQRACSSLSTIHVRRSRKSKKSTRADDDL